ncbi:hypothetical protein PS918_04951 [Pseudomonas fluorescens]|uniref:Uncharacterized protein n=1 Tax=Pseudomonas fluorescens TaxID=294 RepID=A0A5E7UB93_PSEFL|nr:hypothetical protein [Pseudomonas fluorescens]VVQ08231.1 hypothetical protein PS918_04951 [Pseudomonas fluorescens]
MTGFKQLLLAFTVLGVSAAAHASNDHFTRVTSGQTSNKVKKSGVLNCSNVVAVVGNESAWGAQLARPGSQNDYYATYDNVSVSHNGIRLRQEDLMGRYDLTGVSRPS